MTLKESKKRTVPGVKERTVRGIEYWSSRWREGGTPRTIHLGPCSTMTREEALVLARQKKEAVFGELAERPVATLRANVGQTVGQPDMMAELKAVRSLIETMLGVEPEPAGGKSLCDLTVDVAAIRAEREAFIAEEIERFKGVQYTCNEGNKTVVCNTCGSDFTAYPGEADHCCKCMSTDLRYIENTWQTIHGRIVTGGIEAKKRDTAAEKRLRSLCAKKTKHPATQEIQEGWIDESPEKGRLWSTMGLSADDKYAWYARCGEFEFKGFKAADDAKNGLVSHCKGCAERREGCRMPEVQEPLTPETKPDAKSTENASAFSDDGFRVPGVSYNKKRNRWIARRTSGDREQLGSSYKTKDEAVGALVDGKPVAATLPFA